jgi:peptidoglycan/xylan/chitin deacetylase (PgdA/CDA1 family)
MLHRLLVPATAFLAALALDRARAAEEPLVARPLNAAPEVAVATKAAPVATPAPKITWSEVHLDGPCIALTFDDGPHVTNTTRLLDMLAQRHVKATFFVVGENVVQYPDIMKRIVAEGHEIGNHSWSHPNLEKMPDDKVRSQLRRTQDAILQTAGVKTDLLRPPYGAFSQRQRYWANAEFGFKTILWSVDPLDWKKPGLAVVMQRILSQTRPGGIILAHDIHPQTVAAMPATLDALLGRGYKFVTVSELLAMEKKPMPPVMPAVPVAQPPASLDTTPATQKSDVTPLAVAPAIAASSGR